MLCTNVNVFTLFLTCNFPECVNKLKRKMAVAVAVRNKRKHIQQQQVQQSLDAISRAGSEGVGILDHPYSEGPYYDKFDPRRNSSQLKFRPNVKVRSRKSHVHFVFQQLSKVLPPFMFTLSM